MVQEEENLSSSVISECTQSMTILVLAGNDIVTMATYYIMILLDRFTMVDNSQEYRL